MKEIIYFYLIVGCYVAHRKTAGLDVHSPDFLKTYLKIVCTYPKRPGLQIYKKQQEKSDKPQQTGE